MTEFKCRLDICYCVFLYTFFESQKERMFCNIVGDTHCLYSRNLIVGNEIVISILYEK